MNLSEIREQTVEELENKIIEIKKELYQLRVNKATFKLENTSEISKKKKLIAQIKTIIREKHLQNA